VIGSDFDDVITDTLKGFNGSNINAFAGAGGADFLVLGGGADLGLGGDGGDTVRGEEGNDTLSGDANGDYLTGGRGKDRISGGGDADRFIFNLKSDSTTAIGGRDTITDFSHGQGDRIDLRAIDARSGSGNQSFDFIGTDRFSGDKGDLRIVKSGQNLIVQGDIDGDKQADFAILVEDTGTLRSGDFFL
jgi:serralysin